MAPRLCWCSPLGSPESLSPPRTHRPSSSIWETCLFNSGPSTPLPLSAPELFKSSRRRCTPFVLPHPQRPTAVALPPPPPHLGLWNGGSSCPTRGHVFVRGRQGLVDPLSPFGFSWEARALWWHLFPLSDGPRASVFKAWMANGPQKDQVMMRAWNFQPHSSPLREGRGAGNEVSCLREETSIKSQQCKVWEASKLLRGLHPDSTGTEAPVLVTLPDFTLRIPSSGCSSASFTTPFDQLVNVFPWVPWVALANESNLKRESPESSFFSQTGQKLWGTWGPTTYNRHLKSGGSSPVGGTEPLACGIWHYLQVVNWVKL